MQPSCSSADNAPFVRSFAMTTGSPVMTAAAAMPSTGSPPVDKVFAQQLDHVDDFTFNSQVAGVFDDMVSRSVPQYAEIQRMLAELAAYFATPGSNIYDLV